jgi:rhodanese-related sulfurtransferase
MGFERTAALTGGLDAWAAAGNPVVMPGQEKR